MSLALLESRKRVEFWTKSTMHACPELFFGESQERKKRGNWFEKEKVDIQGMVKD